VISSTESEQPRGVQTALRVLLAMTVAVSSAVLVFVVLGRWYPAPSGDRARRIATSSTAKARALEIERVPTRAVPEQILEKGTLAPVPGEVLKTATVVALPAAPGLRLLETSIDPDWQERRARIEERMTGRARAYAIGDLLPNGALLVGISTKTADIMVGDTHLVRLYDDGRVEIVEDLRRSELIMPRVVKSGLDPDYEDKLRIALIDARSDDPTVVQRAIDDMIAAGDPGIDLLMPHVDSVVPVRDAEYAFPSGSELQKRPRVLGEIVMLVLECVTSQRFGDVTKESLTPEERAKIARAWKRWWGLSEE
jgi:hypothetical protein